VGRHLIEAALEGGHQVTLFNRGKTGPGLYPGVEEIHGDRDGQLDGLSGRQWDVVYDINGYYPRIVRQSAEKLRDSVGRYVFVSSLSVYVDMAGETDEENAPLHTLEDPTVESFEGGTYGGLKVLCEQTVSEIYGERSLNVRPGFIVGRYDYAMRLPYLVARFKRGGERLAGRPEQPVQIIHARDLGDWMLLAVKNKLTGAYNLTGKPFPMQPMLDSLNAKLGGKNTITYVGDEFLEARQIGMVDGLSYWVSAASERLMQATIEKALNTGLNLRSVDAILDDMVTWEGLDERVASAGEGPGGKPMTQEREAELLAEWHNQ
jgi:2'-hydroxyisoflavone reductase